MDKTLQQLTENKNIIIVGNSVEILRYKKGDFIDSFDTVVRLGKGIPEDRVYENIGRKFDIWVTTWLRIKMNKFVPKHTYALFNESRWNLDYHPPNERIPEDREFHSMFSLEEYQELRKECGTKEGWKKAGERPSNGYVAIKYFLNKCNCKSITLIGFDFFSKKLPFKAGSDYPSSWHIPMNTAEGAIHAPKEKELVLKLHEEGKVNLIQLSNLDEEFLKFT